MAASDGVIANEEIEEILFKFSAMYDSETFNAKDEINKYVDSLNNEQQKGKAKKQTVIEFLDKCVDELKDKLNKKQKEEITKYLIDIMNADGQIDKNERQLLLNYKNKIGLEGGFWNGLKGFALMMMVDRCPECNEFQANEYDKRRLKSHWDKHKKVMLTTYRISLECGACNHKWSKEKTE
jgi:uncharacterized tellurite resistance protein B-like protein